jgi:hypothetical protein
LLVATSDVAKPRLDLGTTVVGIVAEEIVGTVELPDSVDQGSGIAVGGGFGIAVGEGSGIAVGEGSGIVVGEGSVVVAPNSVVVANSVEHPNSVGFPDCFGIVAEETVGTVVELPGSEIPNPETQSSGHMALQKIELVPCSILKSLVCL